MDNIIDGIDVTKCHNFRECVEFPNNLEGGYYNQHNLCECGIQGAESYPFFCKDNSNCYYKQLKRAEKENKTLERTCNELRKRHSEDTTRLLAEVMELKAELQTEKIYSSQIEEIEESLHHEKAENEELKEEIKALNQELDVGYIKYPAERNQITTLYGLPIQTWKNIKEENEKLKEEIRLIEKNTDLYADTLEEIREIVSEEIDKTDKDDELMCIYGSIYNKIDEVLNG